MGHHNLIPMKNDCLYILRFLCTDFFLNKPVQLFFGTIYLLYLVSLIVHILYFINEFNIGFFMQYFPLFSWTLFGIVSLTILYLKPRLVCDVRQELGELYSERNASKKTAKRIRLHALLTTIYAIVNHLILAVIALIHVVPNEHDTDIYLWARFRDDQPMFGLSKMAELPVRLTAIPFIHIMVVHSYQTIYYATHMKFQIFILGDFFKNVTNLKMYNEESDKDDLINDKNYQRIVRQRLKFCIDRHTTIMKAGYNKNREIKVFIAAVSVAGCLHGIGSVIFVYTSSKFDVPIRGFLVITLFLCTFWSLIVSGQLVQNASEDLYNIVTEIKWYNFNPTNQKDLLLFMPHLSVLFQQKVTQTVAINYDLGVAIIKGIYSVISVFMQTRSR